MRTNPTGGHFWGSLRRLCMEDSRDVRRADRGARLAVLFGTSTLILRAGLLPRFSSRVSLRGHSSRQRCEISKRVVVVEIFWRWLRNHTSAHLGPVKIIVTPSCTNNTHALNYPLNSFPPIGSLLTQTCRRSCCGFP